MRFLLSLILIVGALSYSNPTEKRLREVMREQDQLSLDAASILPIKRTNYFLASRFEINYLVGKTTCWGAAYTVIICPQKAKAEKSGS
jgi:hypothetical protein